LISSLFDRLRHRIQRKRWTKERANGVRGEDLAMRFLQERNFIVVARNFKPRSGRGEIDIVAWDNDTLVFVEVKSSIDDERGTPDRAIDRYKSERPVGAIPLRHRNDSWLPDRTLPGSFLNHSDRLRRELHR
jgi:putative endonuclease